MPFNNPYFPTQFDVGIVNGPHTHIDSNGIDVTDGVGNHVKVIPNNPNPPFGVLPGILFNVAGQAATAGGIITEAAGVGGAGVASFYSVANGTGNGPSIELFATDGTTQNFVSIGNTSAQVKTVAKPAGGGAPGTVTLSATPLLTGTAKDVVWDGDKLTATLPSGYAANPSGPTIGTTAWQQINTSLVSGSVGTTNPGGQLTPNVAGTYLVTAGVAWVQNTAGSRHIQVRKNSGGSSNGGTQIAYASSPPVNNGASSINAANVVTLNGTGDYVEMFVFQDSGAGLATIAVNFGLWINIVRMGA